MDNEKFRIDSEFFLKKYLNAYKKIKAKPNIQLGKITSTLSDFSANGSYATIAENFTLLDEVDYAYMIRSTDLEKSDFINNVKYVSKHSYEFLEKSKLFGGEVLINKIGSPGRVYLMPSLNRPVSLGMNLFMLRLNHKENISEKFLWAYLNTNFGQKIIKRKVNGTVPLTIDKVAVKSLYVPVFSKQLIDLIESFVEASENKISHSKELYKEAENVLLKEIGLQDFESSKEAVNIKSFSESFETSGRLDAEYYQPKYDDYLELIFDYFNGFEPIESACKLKGTNFKPLDNQEYKYIELSNVGKSGDVSGFTLDFGKELPTRARRKVNIGDVIISSIEGSLDSCALITKEYNDALCSTGFYVINSNRINSETLLVLFKSELMQNILKQNCSGTILTGINKDDFLNIPIPIIDFKRQEKIAALIEESFSLKKQSELLLEVAKRAVEIAIEENEKVALEFIKTNS